MNYIIPTKSNRSLRRPLDIFEELFDLNRTFEKNSQENNFFAPVDVKSDEKTIYLKIELPGISKEDINIEYHEGVIKISGEKKRSIEKETEGTHVSEISFGTFNRQITVGDIDFDNAEADYKNGVLSINLPKTEQSASKRLLIK